MAYSDEARRFWHIDLTTRAGALSAAQQGGLACFVFSGLSVLGALLTGGSMGFGTAEGIGVLIVGGLEIALALIAGFRLRAGKGAYWGMAIAAIMMLEMVAKVISLSLGGILIGLVILVMVVQGVRGALALKRDFGSAADSADVFA